MSTIIDIGNDFSKTPSGRRKKDSPFNGTKFREEYLKAIVRDRNINDDPVIIILDHVEGYGSSFLDEAFGGLVRKGYATADQVKGCFEFSYENEDFEFFRDRIHSYIKSAKFESEK